MKNIKLTLLCFLFLNASCAQKDNSIVSPSEKNYEIVNVYKNVDIPWSIEFLDENTIIYAEKKGDIYIVKNNTAVKVENVPEVYFRGQGGLLDLELHPDFKNNNLIYMSYASGSREQGGGNTAVARGHPLTSVQVLYIKFKRTTLLSNKSCKFFCLPSESTILPSGARLYFSRVYEPGSGALKFN